MSCDCGALLAAGPGVPHCGRGGYRDPGSMVITLFIKDKSAFEAGVKFTSKKILQWAVILLGFGMNLTVILETGRQSLPIIVSTIATSLIIAYVLHRLMHIPGRISTLVGVGSSICGGSAIAATAPVIDADDEEVAQSISVIFFFNVIAALLFPVLGSVLGFSHDTGEAFGIFAGTAVNDTSSVTATASTWDSMWGLGSQTLDTAVTVKLTRTLAIIPITLVLAFIRTRKEKQQEGGKKVDLKQIFPMFILYFVLASVITTVVYAVFGEGTAAYGAAESVFSFLKGREQVLHRSCHGGYRPEYGHCEAGKNRRQTDCHGILLLGRHHGGQPADAACTGHLVISARGRKQRSAWEYGIHCDVYRYPRRFFCFPEMILPLPSERTPVYKDP